MKKILSVFLCLVISLSMVVPAMTDEYPDDVYVSDDAETWTEEDDWTNGSDIDFGEDEDDWSEDGYEELDEMPEEVEAAGEGVYPDDEYIDDDLGADSELGEEDAFDETEGTDSSGEDALTEETQTESGLVAVEEVIHAGDEEILTHGGCGDNATYELHADGTLYIKGHGDTYDYTSESPLVVSKFKEDLSNAWQYHVYKIEVEEGITSIGDRLFCLLSKATEVSLPSTLMRIGESAFNRCVNLTEISIPDSVTEIDSYAFSRCLSLTEITFPPQISVLSSGICKECAALKEIHMEHVTEIGKQAFYDCDNLNDLYVPEGVQIVGEEAFCGCNSSMTFLYLPDSVLEIGEHAFGSCQALQEVRLPGGLTELQKSVFSGCWKLQKAPLPQSMEVIGRYAFSTCKLEEIDIPASVRTIEVQAFQKNSSVQKLTFRGSMPEIGSDAFKGITADGFHPAGDPSWQGVSTYFYGGVINWGDLQGVVLEADKEEGKPGELISLRAHINTQASMEEILQWSWSVKGPEGKTPVVLGDGLLLNDIAYPYVYLQNFQAEEPGIYKVTLSGGTEDTTGEIELRILPETPENIVGSL